MSSKLKPLQDGKLSFFLPADLVQLLIQAAHRRIQNEKDELEHSTYFALLEVHSRLLRQVHKKRISLLCSHFYTIFSNETMVYIDEGTQNLIRSYLQDLSSPPPRLENTNIRYDDYDYTEEYATYPHDWNKHYKPMTAEEDIPI